MLEGFPLVTRLTVPFCDIDMMQHANNLAYLRWCETLRGEFLTSILESDFITKRGMIQANIDFTYEKQLRFREHVAIGIKVARIGTKSFDFAYEVWSDDERHRAGYGTTTMVAYDFLANATIAIPQDWRERIERAQSGPQRAFN